MESLKGEDSGELIYCDSYQSLGPIKNQKGFSSVGRNIESQKKKFQDAPRDFQT